MRNIFPFFGSLTALWLATLSLSSVSLAQQKGQAGSVSREEALSETARGLFQQGVKAHGQKEWERCRAAFLAAWKIKQHPQIAGNLSECEAKLGLYRDAAEHLRYFLREMPNDIPAERRKPAEALFEEIRKKVGLIAVFVNIAGAEVLVDDVSMGRSPLAEPFFVEPGMHTVVAQFAGYPSAKHVVDAAAGGQHQITLELGAPPTNADIPQNNASEPAKAPATHPPVVEEKPRLSVRKIVIGAGIATSAVLLGTGAGLAILSSQKGSEAESLLKFLEDEHGFAPCQAIGKDAAQCTKLVNLREDHDRYFDASVWTFVAGGVTGVGTVVYTLITRKKTETTTVQALPMVGAGKMGISLQGQW